MSLISDDDEHSVAAFAAAADVNQLAGVQSIAVEHRVTQGFAKGEFNKLLLAADTVRRCDQVHKPVHQRGEQGNLASHPRVHIQGSTSETGFAEHRLQRLEATNPNHFRNLLSGLTIRPLVRGAGTSRPDFAREENQRRSDQAGAAQQPETVEKTKKCSLLMNDSRYLRFGVQSSIRGGETARQKVSRQSSQRFPKALVERCGVRNQHGLVILRSPREKGGHKSDAEAAGFVAEEARQARRFVVLIFGQEGVCKLAHGHEQRSDAKSLECPYESYVFVVRTQVNAGVTPHGNSKDDVSREDQRLDANFREDSHNQRSQSHDDECTGSKNQPGICRRVAIQAL